MTTYEPHEERREGDDEQSGTVEPVQPDELEEPAEDEGDRDREDSDDRPETERRDDE